MKNKFILFSILISSFSNAQNITFPDLNFKTRLLQSSTSLNVAKDALGNQIQIDSNSDGEIQLSEALNVYELRIYFANVSDLSGIQSFSNLTSLNCEGNQLIQLDLTGIVNLTILYCNSNQLTTLNLTGLTNLQSLYCQGNQLTQLDLTSLLNLKNVDCNNNQLSQLDLTNNTNVTDLYCNINQIVDLDVSNLINLDFIDCNNNLLVALNLKNGTNEMANFSQNSTLQFICEDENQIDTLILGLWNPNIVVNTYCSFTPGGDYNIIQGNLIFDADNNGCDINDPSNLQFQKVLIDDGSEIGADFTNDSGEYKFYTLAGSFLISPILEDASSFFISPLNASIFFSDTNNITVQDFCISANGIHPDLEVVFSPIYGARPGFDAIYEIVYKNKGTETISGDIELTFNDNVLDLVSSTINPTTTTNGNLGWAFTSLSPFETKRIEIIFHVNSPSDIPAVNIDDTLNFSTSITPVSGDETPLDNQFTFNQVVVGAFDPNMITCLEGVVLAPIEIGNYLHYTIEFENTGNSAATNIVVLENLDTLKYDISTLQVLNSSHDVYTRFYGNKIEYVFENIQLEDHQHGNILLKLKSLDTLNIGDTVNQIAEIFFDYNRPVETNNAQTIYKDLNGGITEKMKDQTINVFPNPSNGVFIVKADNQIKLIELFDINGRLIFTKIANEKSVKIDLTEKEKGIYFIKSTTNQGVKVMEIVKE